MAHRINQLSPHTLRREPMVHCHANMGTANYLVITNIKKNLDLEVLDN